MSKYGSTPCCSKNAGSCYMLQSQKRSAWWTFITFLVVGIVPIAPFIVNLMVDGGISAPFLWNSIAMAVTFSQSKCSNRGSSVAAASKPDRNRSQSVQWLPSLLTESVGCSEALPTVSRPALRTPLQSHLTQPIRRHSLPCN